ncbi:bifunctional lysylphosphatidylglycerol flippase/synthetase MprF [Paenarthrobacter sp. NPDC056912]|uniref:bifunctional lysylphosphatidylglycerol flippase/synthetase MprF n=1 Tax=Paenarthrobacter sp. NPDC056912 TaxID=3345965 RepID=UPI00366EBA39
MGDTAVSLGLKGMVLPALGQAGKHLRATPFTLLVLSAFVLMSVLSGSFLTGPPQPWLPVAGVTLEGLRSGEWWSIWTSLFFTTNPLAYVTAVLMILFLLGLAERRFGFLRTMGVFLASQFACVSGFLLVTQVARYADDGWLSRMADTRLIGPYGAILATALAASALLPTLWQRRLRTVVLSLSLLLVLYVGHAETVVGLLGALIGLAAGWWTQSSQGHLHLHRSTGREVRNLLSLTMAIFAVGPIVTAAAKSPSGPLALLRDVILNPMPTLGQLESNCGGTIDVACLEIGRQGYTGPFGLALAIVPVVLLLICADGMRRGRRLALGIAIGVQLVVVALSAVYLSLFAGMPRPPGRPQVGMLNTAVVHLIPLVLVPLILALLLFLYRGHFRVESSSRLRRRVFWLVGLTGVALSLAYTLVWLASGGMTRDGGLLGLAAELARQYLPVPLPGAYRKVFAERDAVEVFLFSYSGTIFWLVALVGVWVLLIRGHHSGGLDQQGRERARTLVKAGGDSLSWMALWEPNKYWFNPDGTGGVAYQQHGNVALTMAGPFGSGEHHVTTASGFLEYCSGRALVPCLYSCTDELWPMLQTRGFRRVAVAQETRLRIRGLEFRGKEWQNVRTSLNRAAKMGITAVWGRYAELPHGLRARIGEVSEEWAAQKRVPEMGFTLGGLDELEDKDVLCCVAVDEAGLVYGVTSWLPVYDDGTVVSWTLDFMRRRGDAFPGVMEFLIASAVLHLRETVEVISLSGSPLAREKGEIEQQAKGLAGILDVVGQALEPVYGFRSLASFKSRFQPEYRTLYMYYQDPLHLPAMGRALSRAYLPGLSVRHSARMLRTLVG